MILYISDDGKLVNDPNFLLPVTALDFKRGDKTTIKLKFLNGTTPLAADPDRIIEFGCKPTGVYDTNFTVYADTYVIDTNDFYVFNPNFNTVALDDLLNNDADDTNDIASVTLISEFTWSDDLGVSWNSTQTYNAIVANDVIRNNEDTPLVSPDPAEWLCTELASLSCPIAVTGNSSISTSTGNIYSNDGSIFTGDGNISTTTGTVFGGLGFNSTSGNITTGSGYLSSGSGNIETYSGNIRSITGEVYAGSNIRSNAGNIFTGSGNIYSTSGNIYASNGSLYTDSYTGSVYSLYGPVYSVYGNVYTVSGKVGVGTDTPTQPLDVTGTTIRIRTNRTIATATTTGTAGEVCFDANYIYRCVATNTWKRSPLTTW